MGPGVSNVDVRARRYKVVQEDLGRGADVTLLHHDVGLVRTVDVMRLRTAPPLPILRSMATYTLKEVTGEVVQVRTLPCFLPHRPLDSIFGRYLASPYQIKGFFF